MGFYKCGGGLTKTKLNDYSQWITLWTATSAQLSSQTGTGSLNEVLSQTSVNLSDSIANYDLIAFEFVDYSDYYGSIPSSSVTKRKTVQVQELGDPIILGCYKSGLKTRIINGSGSNGFMIEAPRFVSDDSRYVVVKKIYGLKL